MFNIALFNGTSQIIHWNKWIEKYWNRNGNCNLTTFSINEMMASKRLCNKYSFNSNDKVLSPVFTSLIEEGQTLGRESQSYREATEAVKTALHLLVRRLILASELFVGNLLFFSLPILLLQVRKNRLYSRDKSWHFTIQWKARVSKSKDLFLAVVKAIKLPSLLFGVTWKCLSITVFSLHPTFSCFRSSPLYSS